MSATPTAINTLTEFLTQAGTQFQLFDMGRQVRPLASDTFVRIEQQQEPYPWPLQQHAWLGVHFFQPSESRHYLWFLKFALDERGLLMSNGPKLFMDQVVETLGYKLTGDLDEEKAQRLADNPYTFRPAEAKMASLHAKLPTQVQAQVTLQDNVLSNAAVALDAVLHHGDAPALQTVCTALAQRPGPIVGVTALPPGAVDIPLERLLIERALSVNTAAAGGNASLMTIG